MLKKDLNRGEGNHLADGASLQGEGNSPADHSHVSRTTPLQTKMKEFAASKVELGTPLAPDIDKKRETSTTAKRQSKDGVRPL